MENLRVVILAAGEGTRMKSFTPKVMHKLCGRPLIDWVFETISVLKPEKVFVVVGHKSEQIIKTYSSKKVVFVKQNRQLGSGHALLQAEKFNKNFKGNILVICGDTPLIHSSTLECLLLYHRDKRNDATILTSELDNSYGYGRICRSFTDMVQCIVEQKDATAEQKEIKEVNSGIYCFSSPRIWGVLKKIKPDNRKKEYYLTDAISILSSQQALVRAYRTSDSREILGVNNRLDLSLAEKYLKRKMMGKLMLEGVTIINPDHTYISYDAKIGNDTIIYPGTIIEGKTVIGKGCRIGPNSFIQDSKIGNEVEVRCSFIYDSSISDKVKIGPFTHLRPGTKIKAGAKVGNFSEVKSSLIGPGSKVSHLSYIGDTFIGKDVNIGAGTITCNYDGEKKNKAYIGDKSFVGSNVNLVSPVRIGSDSIIGAGSTITDNVPRKNLAIARSRQINKPRKK